MVAIRISDGKLEKSRLRFTYMLIRRMSTPPLMLMARRRSSRTVGSGTTSITTMQTTAMGTPTWPTRLVFTGPLGWGPPSVGRHLLVAVLADSLFLSTATALG